MAFSVESLIALAFWFFRIDRFGRVMPMAFDSSVSCFLRLASMTSRLMTIAILDG